MLENSSKTTFTMSRKNGETTLSVAINNGSDEEKILTWSSKTVQTAMYCQV